MCNFGLDVNNFNPKIFYILKKDWRCGDKINAHKHDFITMIFILSGSCTYYIDDIPYTVRKGDLVICNSGVSHGKIVNSEDGVTEFHVGLSNISIEGLPQNCLISGSVPPVTNLRKYEQEFLKCCSDILLEQEKREPGWGLMLKLLVMKLIVIYLKDTVVYNDTAGSSSPNIDSIEKAAVANTLMTFISENYMKDISLETMSKSMYMSPVYISKIFKEETGESPINYLIKVRLSKARELLESGAYSVKAAAKRVGYEDAYHFSKLYKKYYGLPPSQSRRRA